MSGNRILVEVIRYYARRQRGGVLDPPVPGAEILCLCSKCGDEWAQHRGHMNNGAKRCVRLEHIGGSVGGGRPDVRTAWVQRDG